MSFKVIFSIFFLFFSDIVCFKLFTTGRKSPKFCKKFEVYGSLPESDMIDLGGNVVSKLGIGCWAWGDKFFWGYNTTQDASLQVDAPFFPYFLFQFNFILSFNVEILILHTK